MCHTKHVCLSSLGLLYKMPQTGWLKNTRKLLLQFGRLDVWDQDHQPGWVLARSFFGVTDSLLCPHMAQGSGSSEEGGAFSLGH